MKFGWKTIAHEIVYQGYFRIEKYSLQHELYAGGWSETFQREIFERGSAVAVLPYDPLHDKVILIEQFRAGAIGTQQTPWLKEIVAGIIDPGESHREVAERETMEEAGCRILRLEKISQYYVSPGGTTEQCVLFCGQVDSEGVGGVFGLDHEFEDILVETVDLEQARRWLQDGTINSAASIIGLQWLLLNRDRLRQEWL
ncbi:MAG: NUDIX domain-containing protein [Gammaproteobacteria bacterium]|nr:NUDIX domain-containing protein [Gammaproteobacteria bacterium]MBL6999896.1 NUDIX domain-containing protein [Gammaproteobacteria bacterium]